jgi:hypothetical protein
MDWITAERGHIEDLSTKKYNGVARIALTDPMWECFFKTTAELYNAFMMLRRHLHWSGLSAEGPSSKDGYSL